MLKEEAYDYLEQDTVKDLIKKYSQFINFSIYMWSSKTEMVDEPIDDEDEEKPEVNKTIWRDFFHSGIPRLVRFQLVRSPV